jgi:hypothetical protein
MLNNPLIKRYRLSAMRPAQVAIYVTIYIVILLLGTMISCKIFQTNQELFTGLYFQLIFIQAAFLIVWAPLNSSSAIRDEITSNSYDFFKMLPLYPSAKIAGILIGKNILVFILSTINFVLMFITGSLAFKSLLFQSQIASVMLSLSLFVNSAALLGSIRPDNKKKQSGMALVFLAMFFFVPMIINAIAVIHEYGDLEALNVYFYNFKIPLMWLITLIALYFSCWAIKGCLRKFTYERSPLFTPFGTFLFMIGHGAIVLGLFYNSLWMIKSTSDYYAFWMVCFIPVVILPFMSRKSFESYIEFLGNKQARSGCSKNLMSAMLYNSNLATASGIYIIWTIFCLVAGFVVQSSLAFDFSLLAVLLISYIFLMLMFELFNVIGPSVKKIGILVGFVAGLYIFLPIILAGVFDNQDFLKFSPFGLLGILIDSGKTDSKFLIIFAAYNIAISLVPVIVVFSKYFSIIDTRKKMLAPDI